MKVVVICEVPVEEAAAGLVERGVPVEKPAAEGVESKVETAATIGPNLK